MRRISCCLILFLFILTHFVSAQQIVDAYQLSTSNADMLSANGIYIGKNPSALPTSKHHKIQFSQLLPYSISNLNSNSFSYSKNIKNKAFAIEYLQSGLDDYKEHLVCLVTSTELSKNLSLGIKIVNRTRVLQEVAWDNSIQYEIGIQQYLNKNFQLGIHYIHHSFDDDIKQRLCIAIQNSWGKKINGFANFEMKENGTLYARAAINYNIQPNISVRIGWSNRESLFSSGLAYTWRSFSVELGTSIHQNLGLSYGAGFCFNILY